MRLVTLEELSRMPNGTVFAKASSLYAVGELMIMTGRYGKNEFNGVMYTNSSPDVNFGCGDEEAPADFTPIDIAKSDYGSTDMFAVYSKEEVKELIGHLTWALEEMDKEV